MSCSPYALGGAVHIPGTARYIDYLLPGILVLAIGFGASRTGVAMAEDLATGMIDRFRSLPIAGASVLAVAAGIAFSWLNLLIGIAVHDAETAGLAGLFPVIILTFTSSTLVPVATMPGWLQAFAKINPITDMTDALRALSLGGPTARPASEALAWTGGLLLVTVPAAARYRRATSA